VHSALPLSLSCRVLCSPSPPLGHRRPRSFLVASPGAGTSNARINHVETLAGLWIRSPINYSAAAVDPLSLFRRRSLFLPLSRTRARVRSYVWPARAASRHGSGVKFILQIYSFIYCERLFTPVPPAGRITAAERATRTTRRIRRSRRDA